MIEVEALDVRIPAAIIHNWGWFLAFGIGLVLLWDSRDCARRGGHGRLHAVFRLAAGDRGWH